MKLLVLYSELAGYIVSCFNYALQQNSDLEIFVVRWPINAEAPFEFNFHPRLQVVDKEKVDFNEIQKSFAPQVVLTSGWMDPEYVNAIKSTFASCVKVLSFDNKWSGSLRQRIGQFVIPWKVSRYYDYCWVPGNPQRDYALRIGFDQTNVLDGFYSADVERFNDLYTEKSKISARRKILFVGRYLDWKGIFELWKGFEKFRAENPEWELHCYGQGELWSDRIESEGIFHHGFVQPDVVREAAKDAAVFILPSHDEHWGVVVQEFAAAGLPLLCSTGVGSADKFLEDGVNGFYFQPGDSDAICDVFSKFSKLDDEDIRLMGERSHEFGNNFDQAYWLKQLIRIFQKDQND